VTSTNYIYELRRGETVVATGHLTSETALEAGQRFTVNNQDGLIRSIDPTADPQEWRLIIQLLPY
jgi:hypothetical protein